MIRASWPGSLEDKGTKPDFGAADETRQSKLEHDKRLPLVDDDYSSPLMEL